ncbi:MAG: helix-hairpin-helix domain-containing protein, partial [Mucilaginibacter polytrichastri]|nr:helix-hairpin-helix domain-containing protein [Mucilaginibacter polytrichastri]
TLLARNYGRDYRSMFNQAISEGSYAANERGFYGGISINPNRRWQVMAYADVFRFPWLRYRVDAPSSGYELYTQTSYSPDSRTSFYIRYRFETKQQNDDVVSMYHAIPNVIRQNIRADAAFHLYRNFSLRYRVEGVLYQKEIDHQRGLLAYQDLFYTPYRNNRFSASLRVAWFKTDSYDSRIYAFENDVLYSYAIPVYFGHGVRSYLNAHLSLKRGLDVWARYAVFAYREQTTVGSGLDQIDGNRKSDLKIQLRLRF